jgi:hypothetical protein
VIGQTISHFHVLEKLGGGSSEVVYLAVGTALAHYEGEMMRDTLERAVLTPTCAPDK